MVENGPNVEHKSLARRAFAHYLRTGQHLPESAFAPARARTEVKFNPYHDPRDGRFTFAPGGARSTGVSAFPERRRSPESAAIPTRAAAAPPARTIAIPNSRATGFDDGVFRPQGNTATLLKPAQFEAESRSRSRSNYDSLIRPMTLERVFPGRAGAAAGAIINPADDFFQMTGPARELTAELTKDRTNQLISQIRKIDPNYRFDSLGFPQTLQGMANQLNELQRVRAATFYRMRGEMGPLQVETLRFLQTRVDEDYREGMRMLKAGRLNVRLSPNEAVGNFVDQSGRKGLRNFNRQLGISTKPGEPVRVNGREYETRGTDRTYRIPDARVGNVAFDMTLTRKTLAMPQVRGFFSADSKPEMVIIVRPSQLGPNHTYAIIGPGR